MVSNTSKKSQDELFDILDETGKPTGKTISREEAHKNGIVHGASHVYIYKTDENNKIYILLQRRSKNKDSFPNCLDTSSAGHMEAGMNFKETALKELEEELGLKVKASELKKGFQRRVSQINTFHGSTFNNQEINIIYFLKKDIEISKLKLQEEEVSEVIWMDAEEIKKRLDAKDKEISIDTKEYERVYKEIKSREEKKMEESKIELKDIYESAIVEGKMKGSKEAKKYQVKERADGKSAISYFSLDTMIAKSLAKSKGADETVAAGIAMALQSSQILYGLEGEKFLKSKMTENGETFSQEEYSTYIAEQMLSGYTGRKRKPIIQGVKDAINNKQNLEADAAKAGIWVNELIGISDIKRSNEIREEFDEGKVIEFEQLNRMISKALYGEIKPEEVEKRMAAVYQYLFQHINIVDSNTNGTQDEFSKCKKIAYFISDLGYEEFEELLKLAEVKKEIFD